MILSSEPEASIFESGLQVMVEMPARWPSRVWVRAPDFASHILMVASAAVSSRQLVLIP